MKRNVPALALCLLILSVPLSAGPGADAWQELLSCHPGNAGIPVSGIVLVRDAFTIRLDSGAFFPFQEVSGRVLGGIFRGEGRFELNPSTQSERRILAVHAEQPELQVLSDTFREAVFFFTDGTDKELSLAEPTVAGRAADLAVRYHAALNKVSEALHADLRLRLLADLVEETDPSRGFFLAFLDGAALPPVMAVFSPPGLDRTRLISNVLENAGPETTALIALEGDEGSCAWYSERPGPAASTPAQAPTTGLDALRYSVETTVLKKTDIEGRTTLRLRCSQAGTRIIPLGLCRAIRVSAACLKRDGAPPVEVPFVRGDDWSRATFESRYPGDILRVSERSFPDLVLFILPEPLADGEEAEIVVTYQGPDVLKGAGGLNFSSAGVEHWHPVLNGRNDWASYDLTYRVPKGQQVVSVGELAGSSTEGAFSVYRFASGRPIRAAAFNYGKFRSLGRDDPDSGLTFRLSLRKRYLKRESIADFDLWTREWIVASLSDRTLDLAVDMARLCTAYFGALTQKDIAIALRAEEDNWRSFPSLCYLAYSIDHPWIDPFEFESPGDTLSNDYVSRDHLAAELARQWWGQSVGSATYRDAWLEDGFVGFACALMTERHPAPPNPFRLPWPNKKRLLLETRSFKKNLPKSLSKEYLPINDSFWEAAPISLGARGPMSGDKAVFVLHMLRALFRDPNDAEPDRRFMAMMKDFAETWAGRNPSTADFQAVVERHAPEPFAADMGWFFRQWIDGTALPTIESSIEVQDAGNGRYKLVGTVTQSGVPDDFRSVLPISVELEKGRFAQLFTADVTGNSTLQVLKEVELPRKPLRAVINPDQTWLTR